MNMNATVQHDPEGKQFYVVVEGSRAYLAYMDLGKQTLDIYRTFVPDALRGKGLAAQLTEHALRFAEEKGYTVIPSCSYVEWYMDRQSANSE
ncbi:MAG: GNAT family N-acetyltransferase [Halopseudomonas sp.]|uniref:GNAT family N-acetyltransferase n=1 Tax=Halopseudomonas sp. TaxID=2901191 RepID=UPI00300174A2